MGPSDGILEALHTARRCGNTSAPCKIFLMMKKVVLLHCFRKCPFVQVAFSSVLSVRAKWTAFRNTGWWSKSLLSKCAKEDVTRKWVDHPDDKRRLCKTLAAIYRGQDEEKRRLARTRQRCNKPFQKRNPQSHRPVIILLWSLNVNAMAKRRKRRSTRRIQVPRSSRSDRGCGKTGTVPVNRHPKTKRRSASRRS